MKQPHNSLFLFIFIFCLNLQQTKAQFLTTPADGGNKKAWVGERIGICDVQINYNRPGVKGREGKIWGQLVHYGFVKQGFGLNNPAPWRAGANENTTIKFSHDVQIEGKNLPAGKYGLFMAMGENEVTVIFSKHSGSWGSYSYQESEDALRVTVKPVKTEQSTEWLTYGFYEQTDNSATIALKWEKLKVPFKVEVDVHQQVLASMRNELRGNTGFTWQSWNEAATYCLQNNVNLEEGLTWAGNSISAPFIGQANFTTLSTKAGILKKLNKATEADALMKQALEKGAPMEIHMYARGLQQEKKNKEALEVFQLNAKKHPNQWPVNLGLARGFAGVEDNKNALKYAKMALEQAPDEAAKKNIENFINQLSSSKPN